MIFIDSISDLETNNVSAQVGCYSDALFQPSDIRLQANRFTPASLALTITVNVCDLSGAFQEDATAYFSIYFGAYTLGGADYYFVNIRCNDYSPYMVANKCFTINLVINDGTIDVFNKWTQQYKVITVATAVFVPAILIDGVSTPPCIPGENPAQCSSNGDQYVKFESKFDCLDYYTGDYYALGTAITGSPFVYAHYSYLPTRFRKMPTEVERIISINNRTQKTAYTSQWLMSGNLLYPVWKMQEIEQMFRGNLLYVDDALFQSPSQIAFTQARELPIDCEYYYKFSAKFQQDFEWQIFGCVPDCDALATYYLFPDAFERVYDDVYRLIAASPAALRIYFLSIPGTSYAEDMPFAVPCPAYALFKVKSTGVLPKFLYVDQPIPSQRVFPKQLSATATDMSALCNGVTDNNQVPPPDITGENDEAISVPVPDITGEDDVDANQYYPEITAAADWAIDPAFTNSVNYAGEGTISLSISTTTYTSPYTSMVLGNIEATGRPSRDILITDTDNGNMPPSSTLLITTDGDIEYTGAATSVQGNTYTIELFNIKYPL